LARNPKYGLLAEWTSDEENQKTSAQKRMERQAERMKRQTDRKVLEEDEKTC
jgi:hypothetical protein